MILPFCKKSKDNLLPPKKNAFQGDISGIIEKDDIYPRKLPY